MKHEYSKKIKTSNEIVGKNVIFNSLLTLKASFRGFLS